MVRLEAKPLGVSSWEDNGVHIDPLYECAGSIGREGESYEVSASSAGQLESSPKANEGRQIRSARMERSAEYHRGTETREVRNAPELCLGSIKRLRTEVELYIWLNHLGRLHRLVLLHANALVIFVIALSLSYNTVFFLLIVVVNHPLLIGRL